MSKMSVYAYMFDIGMYTHTQTHKHTFKKHSKLKCVWLTINTKALLQKKFKNNKLVKKEISISNKEDLN